MHKANDITSDDENRILCVGVATLDIISVIESFPNPDDKLRSESVLTVGGGNAANTAVAMSRMSTTCSKYLSDYIFSVDLLSSVGDDAYGESIISELELEGIGVGTIQRYEGASSWCYVLVVSTGEHKNTRTCIFHPGSTSLDLSHTKSILEDEDRLGSYRATHFDARYPKSAIYVAQKLKERKIPYSIDVERPREGLLELLSGASIVICNSRYCNLVLGSTKPDEFFNNEDTVKRLKKVMLNQSPNAAFIVTTLGSRGSCLVFLNEERNNSIEDGAKDEEKKVVIIDDEKTYKNAPTVFEQYGALWCEAWKDCRHIVDTTGAGDVFQGVFLTIIWNYYIAKDYHHRNDINFCLQTLMGKQVLARALQIATRCSSIKLGGMGSRAGADSLKNDEFIQQEIKHLFQ